MSTLVHNTVERLDRPSAYYLGKVSFIPKATEPLQY